MNLRDALAISLLNEDTKSKLKKAGKAAGAVGALGGAAYAASKNPEKVKDVASSVKEKVTGGEGGGGGTSPKNPPQAGTSWKDVAQKKGWLKNK